LGYPHDYETEENDQNPHDFAPEKIEAQLSLHRVGHDFGLGVEGFALRNWHHDVAVLPLPRDALPRRTDFDDRGTVFD